MNQLPDDLFLENTKVEPEELAQNTGKPEELEVTPKEMLIYSGILSGNETITEIKEKAVEKSKPQPMDDDVAMAEFNIKIDDKAVEKGLTGPVATPEQQSSSPEQSVVQSDSQSNDSLRNKQESNEEIQNTNKWARAKLDSDDSSKAASKEEKGNDDQLMMSNMSQEEYDKMFHEATVSAGKEMDKSFDELQQEDLKKAKEAQAAQDQSDAIEKEKEESVQHDPLDRQNLQTGKVETVEGGNPERIDGVPDENVIDYTDTAADAGQSFGEASTKNMTNPKPKPAPTKIPVIPRPGGKKSFAEQLLDIEVKKDPKILAELSKPLDLYKLQDQKKELKDAEIPAQEKSLEEMLWERNNPEKVQELAQKDENKKKLEEAKKEKKFDADSFAASLDTVLALQTNQFV